MIRCCGSLIMCSGSSAALVSWSDVIVQWSAIIVHHLLWFVGQVLFVVCHLLSSNSFGHFYHSLWFVQLSFKFCGYWSLSVLSLCQCCTVFQVFNLNIKSMSSGNEKHLWGYVDRLTFSKPVLKIDFPYHIGLG